MTDDTPQAGRRSAVDKERARQQSRAVGSNPGAKTTGDRPSKQPAKGGQNARKGPARPGGSGGQGRQGNRNAPTRPQPKGQGRGGRPPGRPAKGPARRPGPRRSPTTLLTWGVVALVLIVVVVLVILKVTGGTSNNSGSAPASEPVPASIVQQVTHIPASVYNQVGIASGATVPVSPPTVISGQPPLVLNGKPGVFAMLAEYCPYCAAERWSLVAAYSRFGTWSGLGTMQSSANDVAANTQTFTFAKASLTSQYLTLDTKEINSNQLNAAGTAYQPLQQLTKSETALANKYDSSAFLGSSTQSGSIPFVDIGNKVLSSGASYSPQILAGLSRAQIAAGLSDPKNPVTQAIVASANYFTASTCAIDGQQPASVCTSSGVVAAAKALKLSS